MIKIMSLLLLLSFISFNVLADSVPPVKLICLNIGKADCMLLLTNHKAYLIDAGYEQTYPALAAMLEQYHIEKLDGVFLTHVHKDHAGGLMQLAQSDIMVENWYAPAIYCDVKTSKHPALLAVANRNQSVAWLQAGDQIVIDDQTGFEILGPLSANLENENNNSLVMRFYSVHGSILFAGDMKEDEEGELLAAKVLSPCDVLKVGHHGDDKATTKNFLNAVLPSTALILTSGYEEPDTPSAAVLKRLSNISCKTYVSQTYQDAMELTLESGKASVTSITWDSVPVKQENLTMSINLKEDILSITNTGSQEVVLAGCKLYSTKGNEILSLPFITLSPGGSYTIGTRSTSIPFVLLWDKKRIWHQEKYDQAILYDAWGRALCYTDNGMPK